MQTQSFILTIEHVKNAITFPKESGPYQSLVGAVGCTYQIALGQGKTAEEAARVVLDYLGEKMLAMGK